MTTSYLTCFRVSYEALGLVASLNPTASGGVERPLNYAGKSPATDAPGRPEASTSQQVTNTQSSVPKGYGRIVRDKDGNIVDVVLPEEEPSAPIDESIEDVLNPSQDEQLAPWVGLSSDAKAGTSQTPETQVVRGELLPPPDLSVHRNVVHIANADRRAIAGTLTALEEMSQERGARPPRFASAGEEATLRRLVGKYGEDVQAMVKDRKLNPDQRTAGELSRAIRKAGGFAQLRET